MGGQKCITNPLKIARFAYWTRNKLLAFYGNVMQRYQRMVLSESEKYKLQVLQALSEFQTIEFSLKLYISATYKIIKSKLDGQIPFDYSYKDIENHPLEKLLALFKKHNSNIHLQKRLGKLVSGRNVVAHKALIFSHPEIRDIFGGELSEHHENVSSMAGELNECLKLLALELELVMNLVPNESA